MLKARVVTALLLVAGFLAVLFLLPPAAAAVAFGVVAVLAAWEWAGLMKLGRAGRAAFGGFVALSCALARLVLPPDWVWLAAVAFWALLAPAWLRHRWPLAAGRFAGIAVGGLLIVSTWLAMVALHAQSPWTLLAAMALVWVADTAAYFSGRAFGRHKLAPAISPGKTWEGAIGAVLAVAVYGFSLAANTAMPGGPSAGLLALLLLLLTAASIEGDLLESLLKRQAGVKDSSNLLPGHGGILDRIDSQLSTLPLVALILHWRAA